MTLDTSLGIAGLAVGIAGLTASLLGARYIKSKRQSQKVTDGVAIQAGKSVRIGKNSRIGGE